MARAAFAALLMGAGYDLSINNANFRVSTWALTTNHSLALAGMSTLELFANATFNGNGNGNGNTAEQAGALTLASGVTVVNIAPGTGQQASRPAWPSPTSPARAALCCRCAAPTWAQHPPPAWRSSARQSP